MRLRLIAPLLLALALVAGCGGGDDETADSSTDVNQLLEETFGGKAKAIDSARLELNLGVDADSGQAVTAKLSGPFQTEGEGRLPQLAIDAEFSGGGDSMAGGIVVTSDSAFINLGGTSYEVPGAIFQQVKAGYEEAAKQTTGQEENPSLASLGIDPRRWLTNAKNAGEAKVGDTDTIKITGDVDIPKLLDDVNKLLEKSRSLGVAGTGELPQELTEEEKAQVADSIDKLSVELYTGADDKILRRMVVDAAVTAPEGSTAGGAASATIKLDFQLLDVNEDQDITAPENAKPFDDLIAQLQAMGIDLGDLGGALGGAGAGGSGGGGAGGGGAGNPSVGDLEEYSACVQEAAGDNAKVRKCADLLTTP